jgi:UDPglucose 6-dehydrogenase
MQDTDANTNVSIIGFGFVGGAMGFLCDQNNVKYNVYDPKYNDFNSISDLINKCEKDKNYYFISVPTPSKINGECDISIVDVVLSEINSNCTKNSVVIIRSTLEPGSCDKFYEEYQNIDIVLCPEFLREQTFKQDIFNAKFILLGTKNLQLYKYQELLYIFRQLYKHNPLIDILSKSFKECELFKYTLNTFLATKITFFNEIHELCESTNVNYQNLKELFKLDPRIGDYGTIVPGPGNNFYGYSLSCLPKEVKALKQFQEKLNLSSDLMKCIDDRNKYFNNKTTHD